MKKLICALLLPLGLLVALTCTALADEWDFLHTAMRISSPAQLPELMEKSECDFGPVLEATAEYSYVDPTLWGIPARNLSLLEMPIPNISGFFCLVAFDAPADSSPENPGETYHALAEIFLKKYGEPAETTQMESDRGLSWRYQDALVELTWWINPDRQVPEVMCVFTGTTGQDDAAAEEQPFPFAPLPLSAPAEPPSGFSLLKVTPGMTGEEIIAAMGREPDRISNNVLIYAKQSIGLQDAFVGYCFNTDGVFDNTFVKFSATPKDPAEYIEKYKRVSAMLDGYHGRPWVEKTDWRDDRYKSDQAMYGEALRLGDVTFRTIWLVDEVHIELRLYAENGDIAHELWYYFQPATAPEIPPASGRQTAGMSLHVPR